VAEAAPFQITKMLPGGARQTVYPLRCIPATWRTIYIPAGAFAPDPDSQAVFYQRYTIGIRNAYFILYTIEKGGSL
jgi:hypothetical protein